MSKAYLLVICLLAASFTGCVGDDDDDIIIEPILNKPLATIVSISPNPVNLSTLEDTGVTFVGKGDSENGYILEYDWGSSIDGFLSSEKTFTTKNLSLGNHTIFFKVLNDEHVWSEKATTVLSVVNNTDNEKSNFTEIPKWDFFYVDDPNLNVIRNESRDFAIGVANLGNFSQDFSINTSFSDEGSIHFDEFILVTKFVGSHNGGQVTGYSDNLSCLNNVLGFCEGVEFSIGSNDVQIIIYTIGGVDEHINATVFDLYASTSWYNETDTQINETKTLSFDVTVIDAGEGGRQVEVGDSTESFYAGFLASNGRLFDSNVDYIWDNYDYFRAGVTENNRHTSSLTANNVGCIGDGDPSENCNGSKGMIEGFDAGMLGMFVGQTKYVVFPPEQGYGTNPDGHSLGGETLIFSIRIGSIDKNIADLHIEQSGTVDEGENNTISIPIETIEILSFRIEYEVESASFIPVDDDSDGVTLKLENATGHIIYEESGVNGDGSWTFTSNDLRSVNASTGDYEFTIECTGGTMDYEIVIDVKY